MTRSIRCHYDVLDVPRDADSSIIKKGHRKMALQFHPDKNLGNDEAAEEFLLVQQAYECLSDPQERKWYDDHRDAILAGWSASSPDNDDSDFLFDMVPFMHPGCYSGYNNKKDGFYSVYSSVFYGIVECERNQDEKLIELPTDMGNADSKWSHVQSFYQQWESFVSALNFFWEDKFNVNEDAPTRRIRRLMEDENKKARKGAKKEYNQDVLALVSFVKRRDPRLQAKLKEMELQKLEQKRRQKEEAEERKKEQVLAREAWQEEATLAMEEEEEEDRLAGRVRVRLADLEDDYDYGGGKKKRGRGKKKNKQTFVEGEHEEIVEEIQTTPEENGEVVEDKHTDGHAIADNETAIKPEGDGQVDTEAFESDEEPESWRCECCKRNFQSERLMENHLKSRKHRQTFKKNQAKLQKQEEELMAEMMGEGGQGKKKTTKVTFAQEEQEEMVEEIQTTSEENGEATEEEHTDEDKTAENETATIPEGDDQVDTESSEGDEEPESWRCECCKRDFNSEGQVENHMKSKKHKQAFKKYQAKLQKQEELKAEMMAERGKGGSLPTTTEKMQTEETPSTDASNDNDNNATSSISVPVYDAASGAEYYDKAGNFKQEGSDFKAAGDYAKALEKYNQAVASAPPSSLLYSNRAICLIQLGHYKEAEEDCNRALELNPDSGKALKTRGQLRFQHLNDWQGALSDLSQAQSIDFDPVVAETLKELSKLSVEEEKNQAKDRLAKEEKMRIRAEEIRKAQQEEKSQQQQPPGGSEEAFGGMGGDGDGMPPFDDEEYSDEEPDSWICECCKKDFKSEGQIENHMKSKKHKQEFKKYQAKLQKQEEELMEDMMGDLAVES
jgi:DnaJ family protein A protein 5